MSICLPPSFTPSFTLAIPTWNGAARLPQVFDCLGAQVGTAELAWEILIVDNNSSDATAAVVRQLQADWAETELGRRVPLRYCFEPRAGLAFARQRAVGELMGPGWGLWMMTIGLSRAGWRRRSPSPTATLTWEPLAVAFTQPMAQFRPRIFTRSRHSWPCGTMGRPTSLIPISCNCLRGRAWLSIASAGWTACRRAWTWWGAPPT